MSRLTGYLDDFSMATLTLAGPLRAKLAAIREAGFSQVMLDAKDIVGDAGGLEAAVQSVKASGLRVSGLQWLRDFEGLSGRQHEYKVDVAKAMLQMAHALGAPMLLAAASTNPIAAADADLIARDLRKLAMLAVPLGLKVAYKGHGGGQRIRDHFAAWDVVCRANMPNLGIAIDTAHALTRETSLDDLDLIEPYKIFVVRLADFMQPAAEGGGSSPQAARPFRVFPGEGLHSRQVADLLRRLSALGFRGEYSFEVFNEDYQQLPPPVVAARAWAACEWLGEDVLRRSVPLPGRLSLGLGLRQAAQP